MRLLQYILYIVIIFGIFILAAYKTPREGFADTNGMMVTQHIDYNKCLSDCHRHHSTHFRDNYSWMQFHCERRCNRKADKGVAEGAKDMHMDDFNRHSIEYASSMEREKEHCKKEVSEWCKMDYCSHTKDPKHCQVSCERINEYKCNSGLNWSWRP